MSSRFIRQRDKNEAEIIRVFETRGAHVAKLDGTGVPDLVVSVRDALMLVEIKMVKEGKTLVHKGKHDEEEYRELTPAQVSWWKRWRGKPPVIVRNAREAHDLVDRMEREVLKRVEEELKTLPTVNVAG